MMKKRTLVIVLIIVLVFGMVQGAFASPDINGGFDEETGNRQKIDFRMDPLTEKQLALKGEAIANKFKSPDQNGVEASQKGKYIELEREGEGAIWTVLGEFSDYAHNSIPEPDRTVNNTTIWMSDFNREYYMDMLFNDDEGANSMYNFYVEQSSGRFAVYGDVTDWVAVPHDHLYYDDNEEDSNVWFFLEDSVNGWYTQALEDLEPEEINEYLSEFDVWDRYDYDGDGNFDEPDGYIDTFQSVHAGEGEEAGGGELGDEAIWSHSWYARYNGIGDTGPAFNPMGGIQIGNSDYWIGKYTIQPENGGVGVFAHEFGHDLGLPDLYDYYGENGTGFWSLMSSGSWLSDSPVDIGSKPCHLMAWEKLQLGWLGEEDELVTIHAGEEGEFTLGPQEFNTNKDQAVFVVLPDKEVVVEVGEPFAGEYFFYSGMGNDLDNSMTRTFIIPAGAVLTAQVNYEIEVDWDYAYVFVIDEEDNWIPIETDHSTTTDPNGQNFGYGITGSSNGWAPLVADLSAFEGQEVQVGFRYWTDGAAVEKGIMVDEIMVTGYPMDGAETLGVDWMLDGFRVTTGTDSGTYFNAYVCEFRTYYGYDKTLEVGPYYFGYKNKPDYVDRYTYQDGLLISYWDESQPDNNTGLHPGHGLLLPIDAHYEALYRNGKNIWRNRIQTYDATFTLEPTDGIDRIHYNNKLMSIPSLPAVSAFDDRILHYDPVNPLGSVIHPNTGTIIEILGQSGSLNGNNDVPLMDIRVYPAEDELLLESEKANGGPKQQKGITDEIVNGVGKQLGKNLIQLMKMVPKIAGQA